MLTLQKNKQGSATERESFEQATEKGKYDYWLTEEDISDIARIEYNAFAHPRIPDLYRFEISGSTEQLIQQLKSFKTYLIANRLTLIINLNNLHWVSLALLRSNTHFEGFYIDSMGEPLSDELYDLLQSELKVIINDFSSYVHQQGDYCNCGLWALENAADINRFLDNSVSIDTGKLFEDLHFAFKKPRNRFYFNALRRTLAQKLRLDISRRERYRHPIEDNEMYSVQSDVVSSTHLKIEAMDIEARLERFVESFMDVFQKRIAASNLIAKGQKLSIDALKQELKVGMTGALFGFVVSQGVSSAVSSLVASLRTVCNNYYMPESKAQKITQIFSSVNSGDLSTILSKAAIELFISFEAQFMQITDKAGDGLAIEKLAEDAVNRALNFISEQYVPAVFKEEFITEAVILGNSDKYFDPSIKRLRLSVSGNEVQDGYKNKIYTADLFEKIGLIISSKSVTRFYKKKSYTEMEQYGYRKVLSWEKTDQGKLIESYLSHYKEVFPYIYVKPCLLRDLRTYQYVLDSTTAQAKAQAVLFKLANQALSIVEKPSLKKPVIFDLRKPVENFIGREAALNKIHQTLLAGQTSTIVGALSALNLAKDQKLTGSSQASVSGLGGIGKTQLVLRFAQLYAEKYDNNVLWINCDTKLNLMHSFLKLATKLDIATKDRYGENKPVESVIEEIYEYFSEAKSLFIFDNVESYEEIEPFLPKLMPHNKPYVLITSRYKNWQNTASVISLDVFTEQEASELLKQALSIGDRSQDLKIKELNDVLQGLPLALQQAIAYIKNQQNVDSKFGLKDYLEIFKLKSKAILNFNFREYTNDPYLKTVFTTWHVTLEKIKEKGNIGLLALEILSIMSFIYPENIYPGTFIEFYEPEELSSAMQLLKVYSMANPGASSSEYVVHRLVQKVVNLALQTYPSIFKKVAVRTEALVMNYGNNMDTRFHYLSFLLNMLEHPELEHYLARKVSLQKFSLTLMVDDVNVWTNFFDIIYRQFTKQKYILFLAEAFLNYRKEAAPFYMNVLLDYIEKKMTKGILNKRDVAEIIENSDLMSKAKYRIQKISHNAEKRLLQQKVLDIIIAFKKKIFHEEYFKPCYFNKKKRSVVDRCGLQKQSIEVMMQKKFARHIEHVNHIADFVATGLFTKDTIAAVLQGDFKLVAIDFGLLMGGRLLGKFSKVLRLQGEKLVLGESALLKKELIFENKAMMSLFLDKDIILPAKKRILGGMLKMASPFVARGTSLFFIYNLYNDINAYQLGDSSRISSIVSNGGIVAIDGIEMGIESAEALGILTDVAVLTNPVGAALQVIIWLGAEIYEVNKGLTALEQQLHLNWVEKIIQGLRLFFFMGPSQYIEVKIQNNNLIERGLYFLKEHDEIKRFVFPAAFALREKKEVRLDIQFNLTLNENMPDDPDEGKLFCAEGMLTRQSILKIEPRTEKTNLYFCKNAIGIEYDITRTGNATLIALNEGEDKVIVISDSFTIFLIAEGKKHYKGGDKGNLFSLQGYRLTGLFEGGKGVDILALENFYANTSTSVLIDRNGFLCEKNLIAGFIPQCDLKKNKISLRNINHIYGRANKKDIFFLTKDITLVDGKGGENEENADIIYVTREAAENLKVILRANTAVHYIDANLAPYPVNYMIPQDRPGSVQIKFPFQDAIQQHFFFEYPFDNISSVTVENNRLQFNFSLLPQLDLQHEKYFINYLLLTKRKFESTLFSLTLQNERYLASSRQNNSLSVPENAYYIFAEGIELKLLDENHIYIKVEKNVRTIEDDLTRFIAIADRLKKSFTIQFFNNQTALIGSKKGEIFIADCLAESYLVGNGGENIYVLAPPNTTSFYLPELTLYDIDVENSDDFRDTLDLREVIKKAKRECSERSITVKLSQERNDLVLRLNTDFYFDKQCLRLNTTWPIVSIRFKKALLTEWYQKMDIFLEDSESMQIFYTKSKGWFLIESSLVFNENKEIIVLTTKDINQHAELILFKNVGSFTFFKRNESDLIVTNAMESHASPYAIYTILFSKFYHLDEMYKKVLNATLIFLDKTLHLKNYINQIEKALNFSTLRNSHPTHTTVSKSYRSKRSIYLTERDMEQRYLANKPMQGVNYIAWMGIATITLSTAAFMAYVANLFGRRVRAINENPILITLTTGAMLVAQVDTTKPKITSTLSLLALRNEFDIANQCVKSKTPMGLIGICVNQQRIIYWSQTYVKELVNFESYLISHTKYNNYYLRHVSVGQWLLDLDKVNKMREIPLVEVYFQLSPTLRKRLNEKKHQQQVFATWQRHVVITLSHYFASILTLHTPIGNLFKTAGLSLDWHARDDIHFLNRLYITTQQMFSHQSVAQKSQSLLAGLLEIALLQPCTQASYAYLTNGKDFSNVKPIIRFIGDLLQLGVYNVIYLTRLLEWCFPNSESVWNISLGLHLVNSFYSLTGDLSYWYLGMALFVLPFLPILLENIGIPVTSGLHTLSNNITQVFISQSLVNKFSEDTDRLEQQNQALLLADERVKSGRSRLRGLISSKLSFFAQNDNAYESLEKLPPSYKCNL